MNKDELHRVLEAHKLLVMNLGGERADLRGADLQDAGLRGADLQRADLRGADLRGADLQDAGLQDADLQRADLRGAYLQSADLRGAYLQSAYLQSADLQGAKNIPNYVRSYLSILPDEGDVIGWKKLRNNKIAKLLITTLKRSNATNRKCRAEFATVLNIFDGKKEVKTGYSTYNEKFEYKVGETVTCDQWNDDWTVECGGGIHFFITRQEAEDYS